MSKARKLRAEGWKLKDIAKFFAVSYVTIHKFVNDVEHERKWYAVEQYLCRSCGDPLDRRKAQMGRMYCHKEECRQMKADAAKAKAQEPRKKRTTTA